MSRTYFNGPLDSYIDKSLSPMPNNKAVLCPVCDGKGKLRDGIDLYRTHTVSAGGWYYVGAGQTIVVKGG